MIFLVALRKEIIEQWRSYRILIVIVVFVLFGLMSPLLAKYTPELIKLAPGGEQIALLIPPATTADAIGQYIKNLSQFGVILVILMAMGAVALEKDKGTAALILVKPLSREVFILSKLVALMTTFALGILCAAIAAYYYTWILFEAVDLLEWIALNCLFLLYLVSLLSLTLLASTLAKSQVIAGGSAFALVLFVGALGAVPSIGIYLPGQLLNWGGSLVLGGEATYWPSLWVTLGIILLSLLASWIIFAKQEL